MAGSEKDRAIRPSSISATALPMRWPSSTACPCSTRVTIFRRPTSPEGRPVDLSPQQDAALLAVSRWLKTGRPQVFRLFGYAGTGKTTLARRIADDAGGEVLFAAFTGKAAQVMRNKGCRNARTIHSLIYRPRGEKPEKETGELQPAFALNRTSEVRKAKLVIIDECSMVDEKLGRDLLSFGTPILVLGDPGQLPPVKAGEGGGGYFTEAEPDVMLTEIHRQARENPIIALAQTVRE